MTTFRLQDWEIEVNSVETAQFQQSRSSGSPEACGCPSCRNFVTLRHYAYPAEFLQLLDRLGVPADRESEIYHCGEIEPGLHFYGGWFHFVGRIVNGPEALTGGPTGGPIELKPVSETFSMGFTRQLGLVPKSFLSTNVAQLEFSAKLPWVLEQPFEWRSTKAAQPAAAADR
jgi:hypothetical protein